jgi:hypothetical protein
MGMEDFYREFNNQERLRRLEVNVSDTQENLARFFPLIKKFIESYRYIFATIARDPSLRYEPSLGETFEFHPREGKICLSARQWEWAEKFGLTRDQILWSTLHEIAHFRDMVDDPEGMLGLFDYLEAKAKEMAPIVLNIWRKSSGGKLPEYLTKPVPIDPKNPERKMSFVEVFLLKQYYTLYNCLDDIYVNRLVGLYCTPFSPEGSKAEQIKILYRDYLFPSKFEEIIDPATGKKIKRPLIGKPPEKGEKYDLTHLPLSQQFAFALLRREMVPDQEIVVAPEVEEALNRQTDAIAKRSVVEEINNICRPTSKYETIQHSAGWRYKRIRSLIEPIFTELLLKDVERLPPPPPPLSQPPGPPGGPPGPPGPQVEPPEFEWQVGMKVRDKKTGRVGKITQLFPDGSVEVKFINKEKRK